VPRPELCEPIARVLQMLGVRRGMVVSGSFGDNGAWLDEFSTFGENRVAEFYQERGFHVSNVSPAQLPVQHGSLDDLIGGDRAANAAILQRILRGEERGPKRDAVLLNSAAALFVGSRVKTFTEGWELAAELIDDGRALRKLEALITSSH
jgi:anthranilate phosphoribosyltransferase